MEDPTTIALNLTFFATLAVAFVMFFGLFLVFVATLVIAGLGRLVTVMVVAAARSLGGRDSGPLPMIRPLPSTDAAEPATPPRPAKPARQAKSGRQEPALSPEWAAAVARADTRAAARAKAEAAPVVKVSVRDLPSPKTPVQDVTEVGPLVESATDRNGELGTVPRAFTKLPMAAAKSVLDTGSLVSPAGRLPLPKNTPENKPQAKPQSQARKAG